MALVGRLCAGWRLWLKVGCISCSVQDQGPSDHTSTGDIAVAQRRMRLSTNDDNKCRFRPDAWLTSGLYACSAVRNIKDINHYKQRSTNESFQSSTLAPHRRHGRIRPNPCVYANISGLMELLGRPFGPIFMTVFISVIWLAIVVFAREFAGEPVITLTLTAIVYGIFAFTLGRSSGQFSLASLPAPSPIPLFCRLP